MSIRRLNEAGLSQFYDELLAIKDQERTSLSSALLEDSSLSHDLDGGSWAPRSYRSRWELAQHLDELISTSRLDDYVRDAGFWGGLTVAMFDQLCPVESDGSRP